MKTSGSKCPKCNSFDIELPNDIFGPVFTMKPIICKKCHFQFEHSERSRYSFIIFFASMFVTAMIGKQIKEYLGSDKALSLLGSVILLALINWFYSMSRYPYQAWSSDTLKRKVINYGIIISIVIMAIVFYTLKHNK